MYMYIHTSYQKGGNSIRTRLHVGMNYISIIFIYLFNHQNECGFFTYVSYVMYPNN